MTGDDSGDDSGDEGGRSEKEEAEDEDEDEDGPQDSPASRYCAVEAPSLTPMQTGRSSALARPSSHPLRK